MTSAWVTIQSCSSRIEAEIVAGVLRENGIEARLIADDAGGTRPELAFALGVRVQVRERDREEALQVLG